uniref:HNH nuclease domain-containing protein n=1 Tax=Mycena chlorophos TaxID=658473 RepID=A0ABQ0LEC9_MYCCL|nr:predicted protein [Mycena chlorophos]
MQQLPVRVVPSFPAIYILCFHLDDGWKDLLRIPRINLEQYCTRHVRWLLFVACRVWAATARGGLFHDESCTMLVGLDDHCFAGYEDEKRYYFLCSTDAPMRFPDMTPFQERAPTEASSESGSSNSSRPTTFKAKIVERDTTNVLSSADPTQLWRGIEGCHCIPHATGTSYLLGLNHWRQIPDDIAVTDIDDPRNGFLLSSVVHVAWATQTLAFLPVPNAYISLAHIPPSVQARPPTFNAERRLIVHHMADDLDVMHDILLTADQNWHARYEGNAETCVPPHILEYLYVVHVLQRFGNSDEFPEVVVELVQSPPPLVSDDDGENKKRPPSRRRHQHRQGCTAPEGPERSNWERLCALGAQSDKRILSWRRNVAT